MICPIRSAGLLLLALNLSLPLAAQEGRVQPDYEQMRQDLQAVADGFATLKRYVVDEALKNLEIMAQQATRGFLKKDKQSPKVAAKSIGEASMTDDGTIILKLRAEGPGKVIGDAQFRYEPNHPQYQMVLKHVGGLKAGESKPVPPWPNDKVSS